MTWPKYNFNDPALDYDQVLITNKQMYSYLNNETNCCKGGSLESKLCNIDNLMQASYIDGDITSPQLYNYERYKADVKSAYLILYKLV